METSTATAVEGAEAPLMPVKHPAQYIGQDGLAGFENAEAPLVGEYWEQGGLFLFEPTGSGLIFEVSDEDIKRISLN